MKFIFFLTMVVWPSLIMYWCDVPHLWLGLGVAACWYFFASRMEEMEKEERG
jgi:hypothetical protein